MTGTKKKCANFGEKKRANPPLVGGSDNEYGFIMAGSIIIIAAGGHYN